MTSCKLVYLWFKVTVYDMVIAHEGKGHQHLARETPDESGCEPNKSVSLDQLIKIDAQELCGNTQMIAEIKMFNHP